MTLADMVKTRAHCVFEYIYFARLDSTMDGVKVYDARIRGGKSLAKSYPVEADLVTGVPESGLPAAKGFSEESGIPFGFAFYKNSYIGRTFIKPTQKERESSVHLKLSVLEAVVKGKRIVLVDDSIVRGTTIANLIRMLKEAGASRGSCKDQLPAIFASLLFRNRCAKQRPADRSPAFHRRNLQNDRCGLPWLYADRLSGGNGRRTSHLQSML